MAERPRPVAIVANARAVACKSFLGFGAEWDPKFWADYNIRLGVTEADWRLVVERIRWMRMPIVRMMMLSRWCTRGDGKFDWQTPQMKSLYRHLDICQKQKISVILTDWGCATWTKVPGFSGTADPKYAQAVGSYMHHLINKRNYSCIKYFVLVNEPNYEGESWEAWKQGVRNVAGVFAKRKLDKQIIFTGSDESNADEWHRMAVDQLHSVLGAYDIHRYANDKDIRAGRLEEYFRKNWQYVREKDPTPGSKFFIVGEAGLNDGAVHPRGNRNIDKYDYGLFMADYAVQAARAGSSAVIAWMMDDSSHEGFFWGLWSGKAGGFKLRPWFYPWALLCRCFPAGATILRPAQPTGGMRVLAARVKQAAETHWSVCLVNRDDKPVEVRLSMPRAGGLSLKHYVYSARSAPADKQGFPRPTATIQTDSTGRIDVTCPAKAVVFLTTLE